MASAVASSALTVIERDIRILFADRYLLVIMFVNFSIDLAISGLSLSNLISSEYFFFIAPGANLVTATVAAFQSGRDVWRERSIIDIESYLLTLPVSRRRFTFSRLISGMTRTTLTVIPGTAVIAWLYGLHATHFLAAVLLVWIYSAAVVGLSVIAASLSTSLEVFVTIRSTAQVYLSFFSTQFYPASVLPNYLQVLTSLNPMTWAVEAFRALRVGVLDFYVMGALTVLSALLFLLGYAVYTKTLLS